MQKLSPKRKIILSLSGAVLFICLIFLVISKSSRLPQDFLDARENAAQTGKDIVRLTNQTVEMIQNANVFDTGGDYNKALTLITSARANNNEAYEKTSVLAQQLKDLAESLHGISSDDSRRLAYESVAVELSLVAEYIDYTNKLNAFLDSLARAISTNSIPDRKIAEEELRVVNERVKRINVINQEFLKRIGDFDASLF